MTTPNEELRKLAELAISCPTQSRWIDFEKACTANAIALLDQLQVQAERIKELESEVEMWKATANAVVDFEKVQLRAEIAAIAATEPVAKLKPCREGWFIDLDNPPPLTGETIELFTRPMPAQDVTELVEALQLFAYALPLDKSTVKTCYAVNNQMRDAAHAALSKYKGAK